MEAVALLLTAAGGLTSLICFIIVLVNMFTEGDILQAVFGILCCQLWVYIWGWVYWNHRIKGNVMFAWTIGIILSVIGQLMLGPDYYQR